MYQLRGKNLADSVAIYGRGREIFRPPTYVMVPLCFDCNAVCVHSLNKFGQIFSIIGFAPVYLYLQEINTRVGKVCRIAMNDLMGMFILFVIYFTLFLFSFL